MIEKRRVLIANRGEVAVRVARAVRELGWTSIGVHGSDEPEAPHLSHCDDRVAIAGRGAAAYLDVESIVTTAGSVSADLVHPGYGFLAESAELAESCRRAEVGFVGPAADTLRSLGDKVEARRRAEGAGLPVLAGRAVESVDDAVAFVDAMAPAVVVIKALAGGGGRGLRVVRSKDEVPAAFERARSEAHSAFGRGDLYAERFLVGAHHVEIQVVGDGTRFVTLGDRECTLQRRYQKLVEMAPSPILAAETRDRLQDLAARLAAALECHGLVTVEFVVDPDEPDEAWFIEANPRLQVEHTVTEEVLGIDLVRLQLMIAAGAGLADLGIGQPVSPRGVAIQARVNSESIDADAATRPSAGTLRALTLPSGPGVRCDTAARIGMTADPSFDSMLVKVIARAEDHTTARHRLVGALGELRTDGIITNAPFLIALLSHPDVAANRADNNFVTEHTAELVAAARARSDDRSSGPAGTFEQSPVTDRSVVDDPLGVLAYGRSDRIPSSVPDPPGPPSAAAGPAGAVPLEAPLQGTVVSIAVQTGDLVAEGDEVLVIEAMKMEHGVAATTGGVVVLVAVQTGDTVTEGHPLAYVEPAEVETTRSGSEAEIDLELIRPDLQTVLDRHAMGLDEHRQAKVERRHARGNRTARENIADLVDQDSFIEYGPLVIAAQRRRRSLDDLIENTPADGLVGGIGKVNGDLFQGHAAQAIVMSYDYMVLAGTQGMQNHRKKDRLFEIAERQRLPVVVFTEGGGGRPGDTDTVGGSGLDCLAFMYFAGLSGRVPLIGINNGPCFAGNAALLGCCDVVIATANSSIGMGGPAMIEGGGLGVYHPDEVGPLSVQVPNGVVDIAVADEAEAVAVAKRYLAYFQGPLGDWECADQRRLRHLIPENRLRIYDVRDVIEILFDTDSVLELRSGWGHGMVTALARIEGRPVGVIANNPNHLAGAIDADAADKASRFMQLCDAHDLPIVMLCDTPGIMVGPEAEKEATVRHAARMFVTGASLDVPFMTIVLRKGYGLGAQAMAGASFHAGLFTVSWPTGEFGGMGLEGFVKLGYRKELEAIIDPTERQREFGKMVDHMYEIGRAVHNATTFEIDDVIDPYDSRRWITTALASSPPPLPRPTKKRPMIDTW
jgi:acetyl/propionyl-CoA carboxylase alpha subunit